jgi:hypothetical protein
MVTSWESRASFASQLREGVDRPVEKFQGVRVMRRRTERLLARDHTSARRRSQRQHELVLQHEAQRSTTISAPQISKLCLISNTSS